MKSFRIIGITLLCFLLFGMASAQICVKHPPLEQLQYSRPATKWLEAMPVGNSHLGAMVYGGADMEEIYRQEGFDGYLPKPIRGAALEDALRQAMCGGAAGEDSRMRQGII